MVQIKRVLFHVSVICGLVCAISKILDWYNPYMDFGGHLVWAGMAGCVAAFLFSIFQIVCIYQRNLESKRNSHRHVISKHYHQAV